MGSCQSQPDVIEPATKDSFRSPQSTSTRSLDANSTLDGDMSTLQEAPSQRGVMDGKDVMLEFGDQSFSTFDPRSLYGGHTAGGGGEGAEMSDGVTLSSFYMTSTTNSLVGDTDADDDSFFFSHDPQEQVLAIEAPPGKLGLVLDTPGSSPPIVHTIKDFSPLKGELFEGDKLLALDDEDVRFYTAVQISKMLSRKSAHPRRVFTISRVTS